MYINILFFEIVLIKFVIVCMHFYRLFAIKPRINSLVGCPRCFILEGVRFFACPILIVFIRRFVGLTLSRPNYNIDQGCSKVGTAFIRIPQ